MQTNNKNVWDKILSPNEEVKYEFSIGGYYARTWLVIWGIIGLSLILAYGLGVVIFLLALVYLKVYLPKANIYGFTNKRVLIHKGLISTTMISVDYEKITDVFVKESLIDKLFTHTGQISINTAGSNKREVVLKHVAEPYEIKKKLDALRDK